MTQYVLVGALAGPDPPSGVVVDHARDERWPLR
jgi:hypothetical protein